jgi:prolyl 4-hydroxylase
VPTIEDIFPPLPTGTELIPVDDGDSRHITTLKGIEDCLVEHIDLQLSSFFDQNGVEDRHGALATEDGERPLMKLRLLHRSPPVLAVDNFLTPQECSDIKDLAVEQSKPNDHSNDSNNNNKNKVHMVDSATFRGAISTRTSTSWFCRYEDVPTFLAKAHRVFNLPLEQMEEPQIVRYKAGQEFSWHYDEVPPPQLNNGGQRLATLLVYLNSVPTEAGGGTTFRDLKMTKPSVGDGEECHQDNEGRHTKDVPLVMQPEQGSALLFFPAFKDGRPDDRTLHKSHVMNEWQDAAGTSTSTKWIIQMWTHERQYNAVLPAGNSNEAARPAMEEEMHRLGYIR